MFEYFDIHSHLHFPDFDLDRSEIISEMQKNNIGTITIGTDLETSRQAVALAEQHENVFAAVGLHPNDLSTDAEFSAEFSDLARHSKVVAIGECGLDYHRHIASKLESNLSNFRAEESEKKSETFYFRLPENDAQKETVKKNQKKVFEQQINLSFEVGKPLMLHIRPSRGSQDAYIDALEILESYAEKNGEKIRGNAHFFAGNLETLKRFLNLDLTISFTGVLTFTNDYDRLVATAPLDSIMSETDAPFVAPVPHRGKRNSPLFVPEIAAAIARIRGEDVNIVKKTLVENALRNFKISR